MKKVISVFCSFLLFSCQADYTPKPRGYIKLDLPEKKYQQYKEDCPFTFEFPIYGTIQSVEKDCFFNLQFYNFNGTLHVSYFSINDNLYLYTEESSSLAYKHSLKANSISEQQYINRKNKVYGLMYDYEGTTATALQFFLTDSTKHFIRGALYFHSEVNDSIAPISDFLKQDMKILIESFRWKNQVVKLKNQL